MNGISLLSYMRLSWRTKTQSISMKHKNVACPLRLCTVCLWMLALTFSSVGSVDTRLKKMQADTVVHFFIANIYVCLLMIFSRYSKKLGNYYRSRWSFSWLSTCHLNQFYITTALIHWPLQKNVIVPFRYLPPWFVIFPEKVDIVLKISSVLCSQNPLSIKIPK